MRNPRRGHRVGIEAGAEGARLASFCQREVILRRILHELWYLHHPLSFSVRPPPVQLAFLLILTLDDYLRPSGKESRGGA